MRRDDAIEAAERALRRRLPGTSLEPIARLTKPGRRSRVVRCAVSGPGAPSTVVVKIFERPGGTNLSIGARFANEQATLALLGSLDGPPFAPRLFAAHRGRRALVMEDLGTPETLVDPLLHGRPAEAERALLAWARCLGEQHARTAGKRRALRALRGEAPDEEHLARVETSVIGVELQPLARRELADVARALRAPKGFGAVTHHDPCPDNSFRDGDRFRFIDFEFGG